DAEISMGGHIINMVNNGYYVKLLVLSVPEDKTRILEAGKSAEFLGIELKIVGDKSQVSQFSSSELVSIIDNEIEEFDPSYVFTHWENDAHKDHRIIFKAVQSSSRCHSFTFLSFSPPNIYVSNALQFVPNIFVEINIEKKLRAIEFHRSQVNQKSYPIDGPKVQSVLFGKHIGVDYAEGFILIRHIDRKC
ncbi:TPA: PIG-L deacetylase family protein, partial [Streptococcus pneumoniae]